MYNNFLYYLYIYFFILDMIVNNDVKKTVNYSFGTVIESLEKYVFSNYYKVIPTPIGDTQYKYVTSMIGVYYEITVSYIDENNTEIEVFDEFDTDRLGKYDTLKYESNNYTFFDEFIQLFIDKLLYQGDEKSVCIANLMKEIYNK